MLLLHCPPLELNSKAVIERIVPPLRSTDSAYIRFALYYFLHTSSHLDDYIDVFLEGITPARSRFYGHGESIVLDEEIHLKQGLEQARSPEAVKKIFIHFREHLEELDSLLGKSVPIIVENAVEAYQKDIAVFDVILALIQTLTRNWRDNEAKEFIHFFEKTNTQLEAFQALLTIKDLEPMSYLLIAELANMECIHFFVEQYQAGNLVDDQVELFHRSLDRISSKHKLHIEFDKLINSESGNKFKRPPKIDYEKIRKECQQLDFDLLFEKEEFIKELTLIFSSEQKDQFTRKELIKLNARSFETTQYSHIILLALRNLVADSAVSLNVATRHINGWIWEPICVSKIYDQLNQNIELSISQQQKGKIANWCFENINKVDFKTALVPKGSSISTNFPAIWLWYFLRKLNLEYPESVLLDMLKFDWIEINGLLGIEYLEERLHESIMTYRILENLEEGIEINMVLMNHIDYCRRHKIDDVLPFVYTELRKAASSAELRRLALKTACELSNDLTDLEELVPQISDDFKWNIIEKLFIKKSKILHNFLTDILENGNEPDRFKASEYLIKLQDIQGLNYFADSIRQKREFAGISYDVSPLKSLQHVEAVPILVELLKFSYENGSDQDDYRSLNSIVLDGLTNIALKSITNFENVKNSVEDFIDANSSSLDSLNFLYLYLDRLEQNFYMNLSEKSTIDEVIAKLEKIHWN